MMEIDKMLVGKREGKISLSRSGVGIMIILKLDLK